MAKEPHQFWHNVYSLNLPRNIWNTQFPCTSDHKYLFTSFTEGVHFLYWWVRGPELNSSPCYDFAELTLSSLMAITYSHMPQETYASLRLHKTVYIYDLGEREYWLQVQWYGTGCKWFTSYYPCNRNFDEWLTRCRWNEAFGKFYFNWWSRTGHHGEHLLANVRA